VNSRLAALPGLMRLENELMSIDVSDGEVISPSSQALASRATQQIAANLVFMGG